MDTGDFGWQFFTAGSEHAKRQYLADLVYTQVSRTTSPDVAACVARDWLSLPGYAKNRDRYGYSEEPAVDHQSAIALPLVWSGTVLHAEFFEAFKAYMLQEQIVILGGNDNEDKEHSLYALDLDIRLPLATNRAFDTVARWDSKYKFWTLFNRGNGGKVRMTFDPKGPLVPPKVTRSRVPELVDIKITDYCAQGCKFCYQGSTPRGSHAVYTEVANLLDMLGSLQVFEVAIGGGEPTEHPHFLQILEKARDCHIVPNFTTKSTTWLRQDSFREEVLSLIGAFAFSVCSLKEAKDFIRLCIANVIHRDKYALQVVMGVVRENELEAIMDFCASESVQLTLLGYKLTGRGEEYTPVRYRDWLQMAARVSDKRSWRLRLGVDTVLAAQFDKQLKALGVSEQLYTTQEGVFSMYVDAVAQRAGPSSFCPEDQMHELSLQGGDSESLVTNYARYVDYVQ